MKDAVLNGADGIGGMFVITLHHAGSAFNQDLAVFGDRDFIVRTDIERPRITAGADRDTGAGFRQAIAEGQLNAPVFHCLHEFVTAVAGTKQDQSELFVESAGFHQKLQQGRHGADDRRSEVGTVVDVMTHTAAKRNGYFVEHGPEQGADKTEDMGMWQQRQKQVAFLQRQHLRAVPGTLHQTVVGKNDRLGAAGRAAGEEQDPAGSVEDTVRQIRRAGFDMFGPAVDGITVGILNQLGHEFHWRGRIDQNGLQTADHGREDLDDAGKSAVGEDGDAGFAGCLQLLRAQ